MNICQLILWRVFGFTLRFFFVCVTCDFHMRIQPTWGSNTFVSLRFQSAIPVSPSGSEKKKTPSWHHLTFNIWLFPFGTSPTGCLVPELSFGSQKCRVSTILSTNQSTLILHSLKVTSLEFFEHSGCWHYWSLPNFTLCFFFFFILLILTDLNLKFSSNQR